MFHIKQEAETQPMYRFLNTEKIGLNSLRLSVVDSRTGIPVAWWDEVTNDGHPPVKRIKLDPEVSGGRTLPPVRVPLLGVKPDPDQFEMNVPLHVQAGSYIPSHVSHRITHHPDFPTQHPDLDCNENSPYDLASVFVSRLDVRTSKEELYNHFSQAGPIVRITRLKSKQSSQRFSGSAYVQYQFPGSAVSALYNLHHSIIRGCRIVVKRKLKADVNHNANESLVEEGSEGENSALLDILTIFVSNIDAKVTQLELAAHFQIVGDIKKLTLGKDPETGFRNGEAFIQFKNEASVENALTLDESSLGGSVLKVTRKVSYSPSVADSNGNNKDESSVYDKDSIYIANIPDTTTDFDIIDHFRDVGAITRMTRLRDKRTGFPKPCGYIQFLDPNSVESALKYNGSFLRGNQIHIAKKRKKDI